MSTIPLRVCKAITTYKSQGMSIGSNETWTKAVVVLPGVRSNMNKPGLEIVAISRVKKTRDLALMSTEKHQLTLERLLRIGKTKSYDVRRQFVVNSLLPFTERTKEKVEQLLLKESDPSVRMVNDGYLSLVEWYRNKYQ